MESSVFETIVVGADESATAAEAVRQAIELAKLTGGQLHVVSAYRHEHFSGTDSSETAGALGTRDLAESVVADHVSRARAAGLAAEGHSRSGDAANAICDVATEVSADLIVVGNKGMTGAKRFLLGSVPNKVSHHAPCSVLIIRTT